MRITHGQCKSGSYHSYYNMRRRCTDDTTYIHYARYRGRGIMVCDQWNTFENFYHDMGDRPEGMTLERIDNDRGYEPGNCRWASMKEQGQNRANSRILTYKGKRQTMAAWSEELGIPHCNIWKRDKDGKNIDSILDATPYIPYNLKLITYNGRTQSAEKWAKELGISAATIRYRVRKNMPIEMILHKGRQPRKHSHYLTFNGKTLNERQWARELGIPPATIRSRLKRQLPIEQVLQKKVG